MNDTGKEYGSVEQPLNIHWFGSNETTLVSEMTNITRKMLLLNQGIEKKTGSILIDEFREEQAFHYILPMGKFGS